MKKILIPTWIVFGACLSGCEPGFAPQALKAWGEKSQIVNQAPSTASGPTTPTVPNETTPSTSTTESRFDGRGNGRDDGFRGGKKGGKFGAIPSKKGAFGQEQQRKVPIGDIEFPPHHGHHPIPDEQLPDHHPFPPEGELPPPGSHFDDGIGSAVPGTSASTLNLHGNLAESERREEPVSEPCRSGDESQICLGIKYVSYLDGEGRGVESEIDAIRDVADTNAIWKDCGIQFQIDAYQGVEPEDFDLRYRTRNYSELDPIRDTFKEPNKLLVVATGLWDRSGSLGTSYANAWTNLPGENSYGVVLERAVSHYPQILAHELGHYLGLPHTNDPRSLMNPVVNANSLEIGPEECQFARSAARAYWREMFR